MYNLNDLLMELDVPAIIFPKILIVPRNPKEQEKPVEQVYQVQLDLKFE
jgi:hypothetical protein